MMTSLPKLLSTRLLTDAERKSLEALGYEVFHMESIQVELLEFEMPDCRNVIVTSQNALKAFAQNPASKRSIERGLKVFCVGTKTGELAKSMGMEVVLCANHSAELAELIATHYRDLEFVYFSGSIAMPALKEGLTKASIAFSEKVVYKTTETQNRIEGNFEVVLFFSPSGVRSYGVHQDLKKSINLCIGPTTAAEIKEECEILVGEYPPSFTNMMKALADKR